MWTLFLALAAAFWIGWAIRDALSGLFLAAVTAWTLRQLTDQAYELFAGAKLLRPLAYALAEHGQVEPFPLVLLALAAAALAHVAARPADRLKHWDEYGPQKRKLRRRVAA